MPLPGSNFVGLPDLTDTLSGGLNPSETPEAQGLFAALQAALDEANQPAPLVQEQVPGTVNPLAGMAAIFSSTLAEGLGARGATGATRERIAQAEQNQQDAQLRNMERERQTSAQARVQRLGVLKQISDAKLEAFEQAGDMIQFEKELKANLSVDRQMEAIKQKNRLELQALRNKGGLERTQLVAQEKRDQPLSPAQLLQQDKFILQQQEALESFLSRPGLTEESEGFLGLGIGKSLLSGVEPGRRLTDSGKLQVQRRMTTMARLSKTQIGRETALETFLDTLRDDEGNVDTTLPSWVQFQRLVLQAFPNIDEAETFLFGLGL